jgi:hypothetical protein
MVIGALYAIYLAGQHTAASQPQVRHHEHKAGAACGSCCLVEDVEAQDRWWLGKRAAADELFHLLNDQLTCYDMFSMWQAALKALEKWVVTEGAAAGADPALLQPIAKALAKHQAAQQSSKPAVGQHGSKRKRRKKVALPPEIAERCRGTAGDWCGRYFLQKPIPGKVRLQRELVRLISSTSRTQGGLHYCPTN